MRVGQSPLSARGLPAPRWGRASLSCLPRPAPPPSESGEDPAGPGRRLARGAPVCVASARARGRSLAAVRLLPCAERAAVCRCPLPGRVAAGGDVWARVGPLSPGGRFPPGRGSGTDQAGRVGGSDGGPCGGGPVGFGPSGVGARFAEGRRAKGAEAGRRRRALRDRSRAGGGGIPCTFTWRPGSRLRWCALPPKRSPRAVGRRPLGAPSASPPTFPPTLPLARLDG